MGLDWVVYRHRARSGKEREYAKAIKRLERLREAEKTGPEAQAAEQALEAVSHSPYADIGAPRIGIDARATRYFERTVFPERVATAKASGAPVPTLAEALAAVHGQYVVHLARDKGGLAGGSFLVSSIDYGAGIIGSCTDAVPGLSSEAWVDHSAKESLKYALQLERALKKAKSPTKLRAERLARRAKADGKLGAAVASSGTHSFTPWIQRSRVGGMNFDDQVRAVEGMIRWMRFWAKKGYGFRAWS